MVTDNADESGYLFSTLFSMERKSNGTSNSVPTFRKK